MDFDEYRSPGYWLDEEERIATGMDPETGEYLPGNNFSTFLSKMKSEFDSLTKP